MRHRRTIHGQNFPGTSLTAQVRKCLTGGGKFSSAAISASVTPFLENVILQDKTFRQLQARPKYLLISYRGSLHQSFTHSAAPIITALRGGKHISAKTVSLFSQSTRDTGLPFHANGSHDRIRLNLNHHLGGGYLNTAHEVTGQRAQRADCAQF